MMPNLNEREMTKSAAITLVTAGHINRFAKPGQWRVYADGKDVMLEEYPNPPTKVATKAES